MYSVTFECYPRRQLDGVTCCVDIVGVGVVVVLTLTLIRKIRSVVTAQALVPPGVPLSVEWENIPWKKKKK